MELLPKRASIDITYECNLNCSMCDKWRFFAASGMKSTITPDIWIRTIKEAKSLGISELCITGGEPLLYKGIFEVVECALENIPLVGLLSNGELLSETFLNKFRTAPLIFYLSLDGDRETHNKIRSKHSSSFDRIADYCSRLASSRCSIVVNSVIRNSNIDSLLEMVKQIKSWAKGITFQHHVFQFSSWKDLNDRQENEYFGSNFSTIKHLPLAPVVSERTIAKIKELITVVKLKYPGYVRFVPDIPENKIDDYYLNSNVYAPISKCRNIWESIRFTSNGDVTVCGWYFQKVGNLQEQPIKSIWNSQYLNDIRKKFTDNGLLAGCRRCCGVWS